MHDLNEIETVQELTRGNKKAFTALFSKYNRWIYSAAYLRCDKDLQEAEDVVQEVFIKLWEKRVDIDPQRPLSTFLFTIMKNTCLDRKRNKALHEQKLLTHFKNQQTHIDPSQLMDNAELAAQLHQAIDRITANNQRIVLKLYVKGKSYKEISKETGLKIRTVYNYVVRGLETLKKKF
jgi:RNA polymerase sigma-70 factor (ECF subfamily)